MLPVALVPFLLKHWQKVAGGLACGALMAGVAIFGWSWHHRGVRVAELKDSLDLCNAFTREILARSAENRHRLETALAEANDASMRAAELSKEAAIRSEIGARAAEARRAEKEEALRRLADANERLRAQMAEVSAGESCWLALRWIGGDQ